MCQLIIVKLQDAYIQLRAFGFWFHAATCLVVAPSTISSFTQVSSLMFLKRPSELEALSAMRALPRPLARVAEHVVLQVRRVLVRLPTSFTGEWPFARVHALMSLHVPNLRECFSADLAAEWTFSGVYAQVAPQHLRSRKRLVTKGARDLDPRSLMVALVLF